MVAGRFQPAIASSGAGGGFGEKIPSFAPDRVALMERYATQKADLAQLAVALRGTFGAGAARSGVGGGSGNPPTRHTRSWWRWPYYCDLSLRFVAVRRWPCCLRLERLARSGVLVRNLQAADRSAQVDTVFGKTKTFPHARQRRRCRPPSQPGGTGNAGAGMAAAMAAVPASRCHLPLRSCRPLAAAWSMAGQWAVRKGSAGAARPGAAGADCSKPMAREARHWLRQRCRHGSGVAGRRGLLDGSGSVWLALIDIDAGQSMNGRGSCWLRICGRTAAAWPGCAKQEENGRVFAFGRPRRYRRPVDHQCGHYRLKVPECAPATDKLAAMRALQAQELAA